MIAASCLRHVQGASAPEVLAELVAGAQTHVVQDGQRTVPWSLEGADHAVARDLVGTMRPSGFAVESAGA